MRRFLVLALLSLLISACGFLGYSWGYECGYNQAEIVYDMGSNIEHEESCQEGIIASAIPHENVALDSQTNELRKPTFSQVKHFITSSAGANGLISPSGAVGVNYGADQVFTITPDTSYHVADVTVDGSSVGVVTSYTFTNVATDHTIAASFRISTYTVTALVPDGYGSVNPASQTVAYGTNATINITPETDYHVASITHNANPATVANPFVISNVTGNYDVVVTFAINDYTVTVKKPTFQELRDFILRDPTNRKQFVLNQYECRHFATDVDNNAEAAGLRCAFVLLCYDQGQHAVVAFDTTDQGLVYIEPQTDARIYPEVGGRYEGKEIKEILIAW